MKWLGILIAGVILFSVLGGVILAQEIPEVAQDEEVSAQDLGISEPKVLPDHPLYFLKNWGRVVRLFFAFNKTKRAELRLRFANEKIIEAQKLAELNKNQKAIEKVLASFENDIVEISKLSGEELKQFSEKLVHQQLLHQKILQRLETKVSAEVMVRIREERWVHLEKFSQVMRKVEEKTKIADRIGDELEKMKGSKFKEFKDLETLDEIGERMPDIERNFEEKMAQIQEEFTQKLDGMTEKEKNEFENYLEKISGNKLKHLEIISNLEGEEISDKLIDVMERAKEKKIDGIEREATSSEYMATRQIKIAEAQIKKAEEAVSTTSENEYGGRAARRLLELAKKHLESAKEAFNEGKYGRAFGLAVASYHEALNVEKIVEKVEKIKQSPQTLREKFEKLYPGIELPENIKNCPIPVNPECGEGEVWRVGKDEKGCPTFFCEKIREGVGRPEVCFTLWDPVCGKDGKTYSNECFTQMAGTEVDYKGVCLKYTCPKQKIIDCMPIVPPEMIKYCSGPYHEWIKENCDVNFTW